MKILWVCNIMLPIIAEHIYNKEGVPGGGWMTGFLNGVMKEPAIELGICFPFREGKEAIRGKIDGKNISYYGFVPYVKEIDRYDDMVESQIKEIVEDFQPDIMHIFGTEYVHALSAVRAFNCPEKTVINIQGLTSIYAGHYMADVPYKVQRSFTFRDFVRRDNLKLQQDNMRRRGEFEIEAIKGAGHIIGRTDWDRACSMQINPDAQYHFLNETLRDGFYEREWNLNKCERYSLFASQAGFPIKGLHYVLEAMNILKEEFPEMKLNVSGRDVTQYGTWKEKIKISSYGYFLRKQIEKYGLQEKVKFVGYLNEEQMCTQFQKSHIFISPSIVENESNSISEAKMIGTPVVASYVGGVTDRIRHKESGFLYQHNAPYMLAYYIRELFINDQLAECFSKVAKEDALKLHDKDENGKRAVQIYRNIFENV